MYFVNPTFWEAPLGLETLCSSLFSSPKSSFIYLMLYFTFNLSLVFMRS